MLEKFLALVPFISYMAGEVCDNSYATWVSHKRDEVWGSFYAIPAISMYFNSVMLDSDLERVEGQKESCIRTKSQDCKHDLQKYSNMKNSDEFLKV